MRYFLIAIVLLISLEESAVAATPSATYRFNDTFNADEPGLPALVPVDPIGASAFQTDSVFGVGRRVWSFDGDASPGDLQAGLTLSTAGIVSPTSYSVDMVFQFTEDTGSWRRVIDVENRQSDFGFYVEPRDDLQVYPDITGNTGGWTEGSYHHVVLTNDGSTVAAYLDGALQVVGATGLMNLNNGNNPGLLMNFFLDNAFAGGNGNEFADGRVALIRLWDVVLTEAEAQNLAADPFVPEPSSGLLAFVGLALMIFVRRR